MTALRCFSCLSVVALVLTTTASLAGPNRWTTSGPEGAIITQIAADPSNPAVAYAVVSPGGVFRTDDGGQQWSPVTDLHVSGFAVQPDSPSTLYAATYGEIFVSTDAGKHWSAIAQLPGETVFRFAFDTTAHVIYGATPDGVITSTDGGRTWVPTSTSVSGFINSIAVAPNGTAYASMYPRRSSFSVLLRSTDHGQSWEVLKGPDAAGGIAVNDQNSTVYVASVQQVSTSRDNGDSWRPLLTVKDSIVLLATWATPNNLYLATGAGNVVEVDADSGKSRSVGSALTTTAVNALAVSGSTPRRLYAASNFQAFFAVEGEADWIASNKGLPGAYTRDIAVAASEPLVAYAATVPGFFKTDDGGHSWKATTSPTQYTGSGVSQIEVDPFKPDTVYAAAGEGIRQSRDGGVSWKTVSPSGNASAFAVAHSNPATLYAALSTAMSKSTDGGATWAPIMSGLPFDLYYYLGYPYTTFTATSIAVDPSNSSTVYLGNSHGLFKTTDGGASWNQASKMSNVRALAIDPTNPSVTYATSDAGVVKSTDGGLTWMPAGLIDKVVAAIAISPTDPPVLYAGTADGFVYRSTTGGEDWNGFSDGLARAPISRLSIDASGAQLYAGTTAGVYEYHSVGDDLAIEPLPEDASRLPRLLNDLVARSGATPLGQSASDARDAGFVLPIFGTVKGADGTRFKSDLTLVNEGSSTQNVLLAWLSQAGGGDVRSFRIALPAMSDVTGGIVTVSNLDERLGVSGLGSLVVIAIDASGNLDSTASLDGSAHIWTHSRAGRAPLLQSIGAVRADLFRGHARATAGSLRQDTRFRTNVGMVNLSGDFHQFIVAADGDLAATLFTIGVPAFSLVHVAVPPGDYGTLSLTVYSDSSSALWVFYGSTIDNVTGEASTLVGKPSGDQ